MQPGKLQCKRVNVIDGNGALGLSVGKVKNATFLVLFLLTLKMGYELPRPLQL